MVRYDAAPTPVFDPEICIRTTRLYWETYTFIFDRYEYKYLNNDFSQRISNQSKEYEESLGKEFYSDFQISMEDEFGNAVVYPSGMYKSHVK